MMNFLKRFWIFGHKDYSKGMSLLEIMLALTLFAIFAVFFIGTQQFQVKRAMNARNKIDLLYLCDLKFKETLFNPKNISSMVLVDTTPDTTEGTFEEPYQEYTYKIAYYKFFFPPIEELQGMPNGESGAPLEIDTVSAKILKTTKELLEKNMVQLKVSVIHEKTKRTTSLETWLSVPIDGSSKFKISL